MNLDNNSNFKDTEKDIRTALILIGVWYDFLKDNTRLFRRGEILFFTENTYSGYSVLFSVETTCVTILDSVNFFGLSTPRYLVA